MTVVDGDMVAAIGENRKMLIFPLDQVPEMARGRGVRLQRYKDGGLSDVKTFKGGDGLTWIDSAGRTLQPVPKELADWRGNRGDAGRLRPSDSSPTTNSAWSGKGARCRRRATNWLRERRCRAFPPRARN